MIRQQPRTAVRHRWREPDGGVLICSEPYRPRRRWYRLTRAVGVVLVAVAAGWPLLLLAGGWPRLALCFAVADVALGWLGVEVMRAGAARWSAPASVRTPPAADGRIDLPPPDA